MTLGGVVVLVVIGTTIWTYFDSRERDRDSPLGDAFVVLILWIVGFPYYLVVRHREQGGRCRRCRKKLKPYGADECWYCGWRQPWAPEFNRDD